MCKNFILLNCLFAVSHPSGLNALYFFWGKKTGPHRYLFQNLCFAFQFKKDSWFRRAKLSAALFCGVEFLKHFVLLSFAFNWKAVISALNFFATVKMTLFTSVSSVWSHSSFSAWNILVPIGDILIKSCQKVTEFWKEISIKNDLNSNNLSEYSSGLYA